MVVPLLPLLRRRNLRTGMVPVWLLEKIYEHAVELGQYLLALIYGCLWESASGSMKGGTLWFNVVPNEDKEFYHHLEVVPLPSDFVFFSVLGPFMRANEELGRSGEVVDFFRVRLLILPISSSRYRTAVTISLGLMTPPIPLTYLSSPFYRGFKSV